jgi:hypothetical protein
MSVLARILLIIALASMLMLPGCAYDDAGAPDIDDWIGNTDSPYEGIVALSFFSWNGTAFERLANSGNVSFPDIPDGILKGDNSTIVLAEAGVDYQLPLEAGVDYQTPLEAGVDYQTPLGQGCRIYYNSTQSVVGDGTNVLVSFNSEDYDTDNLHYSSNATCIVNTDGIYAIHFNWIFSNSSSGYRKGRIRINDVDVAVALVVASTNMQAGNGFVMTIVNLFEGDTIKIYVAQNSGTTLTLNYQAGVASYLVISKIG